MIRRFVISILLMLAAGAAWADGVFVRFKMEAPAGSNYYVKVGGYIHREPWYLPSAVWPEGADRAASNRVVTGEFTPWLDVEKWAGKRLHGRLARAGGISEFPNVTADFIAFPTAATRRVVIELATSPSPKSVVKRFKESYAGSLTSFLVSPDLKRDADALETASEMTERRLGWARKASGGRRVSPQKHLIQTGFWAPQRTELNLKEAEVLWLLGFNTVGQSFPGVTNRFAFNTPGHTHSVRFDPGASRADLADRLGPALAHETRRFLPGTPFNFSDEVTAGQIGNSVAARSNFTVWLTARGIGPADLGVTRLDEVMPIETPDAYRARAEKEGVFANRIFYYTSRFRQEATSQRFRWNTEILHARLGPEPWSSTLVADHPYFSGTGLGMGWGPNPAWSSTPLAADWFDLARTRAVDAVGIEDWMGLQYMYGPNYTWEGFQLMGFQSALIRSAGRGEVPIIAWITPSDETNLVLKTSSALCQGARHFFYWTYGPTATSTENYWSDLPGAHAGIVRMTRQMAFGEPITAEGRQRPTRVALVYSISSDLWQPFGYVHMLERRLTYLALVHEQFQVDFLTEEDIVAGRLADYDVVYATDPCLSDAAADRLAAWVRAGGHLTATGAAGSRNEFNQMSVRLQDVLGLAEAPRTEAQDGRYHIRGALNAIDYLEEVRWLTNAPGAPVDFGVMGVRIKGVPATGSVVRAVFRDGAPAAWRKETGAGETLYLAACPGLAYGKEAKFVASELRERWPMGLRQLITASARERVARPVDVSQAVVEAGVYDHAQGTALWLANFTYEPVARLTVRLPVARPVKSVRSFTAGSLKFTMEPAPEPRLPGCDRAVVFTLPLGLNDLVRIETAE
jgi:hypothetical protein